MNVVTDTFTDVDATTLPSHTPDYSYGSNAWVNTKGTNFVISSNKAIPSTSTPSVQSIDTEFANYTFSCDITLDATSNSNQGIAFRVVGSGQYFFFSYNGYDKELAIYEYDGTLTKRTSVTDEQVGTVEFKVVLIGDTVTCYIDDVSKLTYDNVGDLSETKAGLYSEQVDDTIWDNVSITSFVDVLTATGISTTPVLATPTIAQKHALTATGVSTTPVLGTPTLSNFYIYLKDEFDEASDTNLTSHTPDINNTGNSYVNIGSRNPLEILGGGLGGDGLARSKYIDSYVTGYGGINLGSTVNDLSITSVLQGYGPAYNCDIWFGCDSTFDNGWVVAWGCDGTLVLYEFTSGIPADRATGSPASSSAKRTLVVDLSGSNVNVNFNSGEVTLNYGSYTPKGQYVGVSLARKDSGYHRIFYLDVVGDSAPGIDALTATAISTTPVFGSVTISQKHALTASTVVANPVLGSPSLTSEHTLSATGILVLPSIGTPTLVGEDNLESLGISTTPSIGTTTLVELPTSSLSASGLVSSSPVLSVPLLAHVPTRTYPYSGQPPTINFPVYILDPDDLEIIGLIEDYYSLVWTEKYNEFGEFELELPIEYDENPLVAFNNFLYIKSSERLMIIEDIKPATGEDKTFLLVKGRSAESLLFRRVLILPKNVSGTAKDTLYSLIEENFTNATNPNRNISIIRPTFPAPAPGLSYNDQLDSQVIYDIVEKVCKASNLGFKFVKEPWQDPEGGGDPPDPGTRRFELVFYVYEGEDRSFGQVDNSYVIFSDNFDNVVSSSFYLSEKGKINIILVSTDLRDKYGEEEDSDTLDNVFVWYDSEPSGINRYETVLKTQIDRTIEKWPVPVEPEEPQTFNHPDPVLGRPGYHLLDAVDLEVKIEMAVNWNEPEPEPEPLETPLTDEEVLEIITTRGSEVLDTWKSVGLFEGDFDIEGNFKYGTDFFMGDIVQCNLEGRNVKARIVELVRSYSTDGIKSYLAFDFII